MNHGKTIAVAGNQTTTVYVLNELLDAGYEVEYLINVGPEQKSMIADYIDLTAVAEEKGIELLRPPSYAMKDPETRALFEGRGIDMLVSVGWQRLIPGWLLSSLSIGAFGMHGSAEPLPRGRGRSPMNWSIIEDRDRFLTHLFRYDEGIDSGMIVAVQRFDIFPWDTIQSLQHKNAYAQAQLLVGHLPALLTGTAELAPQRTDIEPTYYPKRVPGDGVIDWRDRSERIDRIVRAVARPYPGAFTFDGDRKVFIWRGGPFDRSLPFGDSVPGQIVATFHDNTFVVRCGDDSYYVTDWEAPEHWEPRKGTIFESRTNPSWEKLKEMNAGSAV